MFRWSRSRSSWSALAGQSAFDAGLALAPARCAKDLSVLIRRAQENKGASFLPSRARSLDAAAVFAGFLAGQSVEEHVATAANLVDQVLAMNFAGKAGEEDAHFVTYAAFQAGGEAWARFFATALEPIRMGQVSDGAEAGSWSGADSRSQLRRTTLNTLTLEVLFRCDRLQK